jgi:hypothetical protein
LEYNLIGKTFKYAVDENGNTGVKATLPVILIDNLINDSSLNAGRVAQYILEVSSELIVDDNGNTVYPYSIIKQCMNTDIEYYTSSGLRTAAFSYLNLTTDTSGKIYERFNEVKNGDVAPAENVDYYLNGIKNDATHRDTLVNYMKSLDGYKFDNWCTDLGSYSDLSTKLLGTVLNESYDVDLLRNNFMSFSPNSVLVPASRNSSLYGLPNGYAARYPDDKSAYAYKMIQWILGATGTSSITPSGTGGTSSTLALNILEIEPCNDFTYTQDTDKGKTATAELLTDIVSNGAEYVYNSTSNMYEVKDSSTAVTKTKYSINVDCYTVNAFDGLTTDIIAEYDIVYIGTNKSQMYAISSSSTLYYPQTDTLNSNDLTQLKKEEIEDFVDAGKILLLANDMTTTTLDANSQMYKLIAGVESYDNTVFRNDAKQIYVAYQSDCTPTITSVTTSGATGTKGSELSYDANGLIDAIVEDGFTTHMEIANCKKGKTYCVAVIIDQDNDGVYGEDSSEYKTVATVEANDTNMTKDATTGNYSFSLDLSITVPEDYISDMIAWKIGIYEVADKDTAAADKQQFLMTGTTDTYVTVNKIKRDTYTGFTPMTKSSSDVDGTVTINVLQITENDSDKLTADSDFMSLLSAAGSKLHYTVNVTSLNPKNASDTAKLEKTAIEKGDYQMLIVGTGTYSSLSDTLKATIQEWVSDVKYQGNSVLFMNDTDKSVSSMGLTLDQIGQKDGTTTTGYAKNTATIGILNDGQMNQFPYNISDGDVTINSSNPENYQLILDFVDATAKTSKGIVVWDSLTGTTSGDFFYADYKDAINNYYMYTMGNVTYTAMGTCNTDTDRKLMVNAIIRSVSKQQFVDKPAIVVNNGVMTAGGYNIYVDLDDIKDVATRSVDEANALRASAYVINFTATNYDNTDMDGWMYWYQTPGDENTAVLLYEYTGSNRLKSGVAIEENLTSLSGTLANYEELISQIEAETVDIRIRAKNNDNLESEKRVTFRRRSMYNLK